MIEFWDQLVNAALLGTDKKELPIQILPESIQSNLTKEKSPTKEDFFLNVACLSLNYVKSGVGTEKIPVIAIPPSAKETLSYTPIQASLILKKLLEDEDKNPYLIEYWLEKCEAKKWIVPVDYLVLLLELGAEKKYKFLQAKIRAVIGKRGEWVAQFNQAWHFVQQPNEEQLWLEGKSAERLEVWQNIRDREPERARELLQTQWNQENAKDKVSFLPCLETNLSPADEPFLQGILDNLSQAKEGNKPVNQEIKSIAARLLLSLPTSKLCQEVQLKMKSYIQKKKKLISLLSKTEINLALPKKEDDFFSVALMHHRLGFEKITPDDKLYTDIEYWFNELVKYLPPIFWVNTFQVDIKNVIQTFNENTSFTKTIQKKQTPVFMSALAEAIGRHRHEEGALAWVNYFKSAQTLELCNLLPQHELEEFYLSHMDISSPDKNRNILLNKRLSQWSLNFTRHVVQMLSKSVEKYYYSKENQPFIQQMILFLHPGIMNEMESVMKDKSQEWLKQQWRDTVVIPVIQMLEIRQEIEETFSQ